MDSFDDFWLFVRKYLFSILLILAGLMFLIKGVSTDEATDLSQSRSFLLGAIALFILGFVSLYFILDKKINKTLTVILSGVFLVASGVFIWLNIQSVQSRIDYRKDVVASKKLAQQGLSDVKKLQEAYDRKFKKFATSFDELARFAQYDSIVVLTKATGDIPDRKMTVEEAKILGYQYPKSIISEAEAIKLGLIVREYNKVPVAEEMFFSEDAKKEKREYDFDVKKLNVQRTIDDSKKEFSFKTRELPDSTATVLIQAIPPYGPQTKNDSKFDIRDTLQLGGLLEKSIKSNWK